MPKRYYTRREVAQRLGESITTIKYWEREFKHLASRNPLLKNRRYEEAEVIELEKVRDLLRIEKLTVAGAKERFAKSRTHIDARKEVELGLKRALDRLVALRDSLKSIE